MADCLSLDSTGHVLQTAPVKTPQTFRELLEAVATKRDIPLSQLAEETGLARASLYRWMDGRVPHFLQIGRIAKALKVPEKTVRESLEFTRTGVVDGARR